MPPRAPSLHRGPGERVAAWLVTGPLGHLYSVVADIGSYAVRSWVARARGRPLP